MEITVLFFGITRDITGMNTLKRSISDDVTLFDFIKEMKLEYPILKEQQFSIAINENYITENQTLHENDVIALIPPVSGG